MSHKKRSLPEKEREEQADNDLFLEFAAFLQKTQEELESTSSTDVEKYFHRRQKDLYKNLKNFPERFSRGLSVLQSKAPKNEGLN